LNSDADSNSRSFPAAKAVSAATRNTDSTDAFRLRPAPDRQALFLDVDGTLLPIAPHPDAVRVAPDLLDLLRDLTHRCGGALALVSGRSIANIDALFAPLRLPCAGIHGLERRGADRVLHHRDAGEQLAPLRRRLADYTDARKGLLLEDKGRSLALHFRGAPEYESEAEDFLRELLCDTPSLELTHGKMVLEVKPAGANKGTAIEAFLREPPFAGRQPVFIGDDVTDEDGFDMVNRLGGLSIRVGAPRDTAAAHSLADEAAVHTWLTNWLDDKQEEAR
jgi:trehalose 6-phosphate phosphatase